MRTGRVGFLQAGFPSQVKKLGARVRRTHVRGTNNKERKPP